MEDKESRGRKKWNKRLGLKRTIEKRKEEKEGKRSTNCIDRKKRELTRYSEGRKQGVMTGFGLEEANGERRKKQRDS